MATDATDNAADPGLWDKLSTIYWGNSPNINQALRQRIALQMMGQGAKKGYPKTIGEGLSAVGDSLGDIGLARMLERSDQAAQRIAPPAAAASTADATPTASASNAMAYAPPEQAEPAAPPADAPGNVMSPAVAPSSAMLAPALPTGLGGAGPPMTPPQTASLLNPRSTLGGTAPRVPAELDPAVQPDPQQRDRIAATLNGQQLPQGVQQLDPTLAGAVALPPSTMARGGPQPDQRVAQLAPSNPRTAVDISRAPAPPVQQQPTPIPGYVPPQPGAPSGAPLIGMTPRELQLKQWLAANQGNPYAAMKVAPEISQLELARTTRQNEANELYKAQILRDTEQAKLALTGRMDQAKRVQDWQQGQQTLIAGGPQQPGAPAGLDPRLGTPQSPQRTGVPTAGTVPPGVTPQQWAEKQTPELVKAVNAVEKATPAFREMIKTLDLAEQHPGREWGIGPMSDIARRVPGSAALGFSKIMEQIGGKNFLNAYQQLKGGGSITEIEGTKAEAAQARLSTAQNKDDFDRAMKDFKDAIRSDMETAQRKVNQPVTAWQRNNEDPYAPDKGEIVSGFKDGRAREYLGGDPRDISGSWRLVR